MASTYVAGGDLEYGRYGNPTWTAFEDALGALEGGRCLAFASGLAAVATVLDLVGHGGVGGRAAARLQRHASCSSPTSRPAAGSRARLVDITDTDAVVAACDDAALVWLESPTNPALEVADIPAIAPPRTRPARTSSSTTPSPLPCSSGRSTWAPTSSCTRRRSTSPGTATS